MEVVVGILGVLGVLIALAATILAFIFIVPDKRRAKLNGFGKFLHDTVNFKYLIIEKILQALYIFATTLTITGGFAMLFYVEERYHYGYYNDYGYTTTTWYGWVGILVMLLGPIAVRLSYEIAMMAIILVKNVIQINNKLKGDYDTKEESNFSAPSFDYSAPYSAPVDTYAAPAQTFDQPAANTCPVCGVALEDGPFCPACGAKVK